MIDVNELRKGVTFELDEHLYQVLEYSHNKPGRGNASIRTRVRDLRSGGVLEKTFQSGDRVQDIRLDHHQVQFLYADENFFHFMDSETFEQSQIPRALIGDSSGFMKEGLEVKLTLYNGEAINVDLPASVDLRVTQAEVAVKGDTATGATKLVTTETGLKVSVPLFVNAGDIIRVDTRTGNYLTRV
jgi:elongation factor P